MKKKLKAIFANNDKSPFWHYLFIAGWFFALSIIALIGCGDVEGTVSSLSLSPATATVGINKVQVFNVSGKDTVGNYVVVKPTYSVQGGIGTISSSGVFTAGSQEGIGAVTAAVGEINASSVVTVTASCWVIGRISDQLGKLVSGIKVYLQNSNYFAFTDSTGSYNISGVAAGTYEVLTQQTSTYKAASIEVEVASGETQRADMVILYYTLPPDQNIVTPTLPSF